jgi:hypothetical protein
LAETTRTRKISQGPASGDKSTVRTKTLVRDPDNLVVWLGVEKGADGASEASKVSLINAEIQSICNDHISTLDDALHKKSPRPNPTPRIFIEQGSACSRILWLRWES